MGESKEKDSHRGGLEIQRVNLQWRFDALVEFHILKVQSNSSHSEIYSHMIKTYFSIQVRDLPQYRR